MENNKLTDKENGGSGLKKLVSGLDGALNFKSPAMKVLSVALMLFFGAYGAKFVIGGFSARSAPEVSASSKSESDALKEKVVSLERKLNALDSTYAREAKCRTFSIDELMADSAAGKQILEYVKNYGKAADEAIAKVREMLKGSQDADIKTVITYSDEKGAVHRASISSLSLQKIKVAENGKSFFRTLLAKALKERPLPENILLLEEDVRCALVPKDADMTKEIAERMGYIKVKLPEVPAFSVVEVKDSEQKSAAPAGKKAGQNKSPGKGKKSGKSK